jgi:hypothetical protein
VEEATVLAVTCHTWSHSPYFIHNKLLPLSILFSLNTQTHQSRHPNRHIDCHQQRNQTERYVARQKKVALRLRYAYYPVRYSRWGGQRGGKNEGEAGKGGGSCRGGVDQEEGVY